MLGPDQLPDLTPQCAGAVIVRDRQTFLFVLGDEDRWEWGGRQLRVPLSGVGGGINEGEHPLAALQREAQEEIGAELSVSHSPVPTLGWINGGQTVYTAVLWREEPAPAFVIRRDGDRPVCTWLYAAALQSRPVPADVPGLAWVPLHAVSALLAGVPLASAPEHGIELVLRDGVALPRQTILCLPEDGGEATLLRPTLERLGHL